ncbi:MAG TPA: enoyl-CoA hydratase/isomerase family protein [Actinomycetota bacterium]|nr:enoyl-CoA hydratase/isomerase family protein [Actinomycetota bacterium]
MSDAPVLASGPGPIRRITMNRPEARNAMSAEMRAAMVRALGDAAADPACRVVVIDGAGADFSAGADLDELSRSRETDDAIDYVKTFEDILRAVEDQPQPVIAEVGGAALGAGCLLVLACDLAVAAAEARLGIPSARLGLVVNYESVERLVAAVGLKRASDLLEAGHEIGGKEAAEWGLVNRAVPAAGLRDAVDMLARRVAGRAPLSVKASKRGIRGAARRVAAGSSEAYPLGDFDMMAAEAFASQDLSEGMAALRERRRPEFEGR